MSRTARRRGDGSGAVYDRRALLRAAALGGVAALAPIQRAAQAAPDANLWERWLPADAANPARIDHDPWNALLQRYRIIGTDGVARFAYRAVTFEDRDRLHRYIASLAALPIRQYRREAQFAYWVNLYNAVTVNLILDHYPVESILDIDISPGFFSDGPWEYPLVEVEGADVTLDDIQHRILRPIWRTPLIHYAVNRAANGSPNVASVAYTAENSSLLLVEGAAIYINDPRGARIDRDGDFVVSEIYDDYEDDFGGSEESVLAHLAQYGAERLRAILVGRDEIDDYRFDWRLNDAVV
ncbi:MAG: DUF547 domain-containing protein [Dongiaceae bacterium]